MRAGECWIFDTWREHHVVNDHYLSRIHLVADTVGGAGFWEHVNNARPHVGADSRAGSRGCSPVADRGARLDFEAENFPRVMTPWEIRVASRVHDRRGSAHTPPCRRSTRSLLQFARAGTPCGPATASDRAGWDRYRGRCSSREARARSRAAPTKVDLRNGVRLMEALEAWVFEPALAAIAARPMPRSREPPRRRQSSLTRCDAATSPLSDAARRSRDPVFDRPVFIVCPPRSGSTFLFETLAQSPDVFTIGDESHQLIEGVPTLAPESRGFESNRLLAAGRDAGGRQRAARAILRGFARSRPATARRRRRACACSKRRRRTRCGCRSSRRFSRSALHLSASGPAAGAVEHDGGLGVGTIPHLSESAELDRTAVVAAAGARLARLCSGSRCTRSSPRSGTRRRACCSTISSAAAASWTVASYEALVADPATEIRRLCAANFLAWDSVVPQSLPLSRYTVSTPDPTKWQRHAAEIDAVMPMIEPQARRAERLARRSQQT